MFPVLEVQMKVESLLAAAKPAELLAMIGQPRMIEENVASIALMGGAQVLQGRPDEAKHLFETAVSLRPQDPRLMAYLAGARAQLDDFTAARAALDKMLWLDPLEVLEDDRAPLISRHVALGMIERLDKMRDASGDPPCVDAITALLWFYAGDREQAKKAARKSSDSAKPPLMALVLEGHLVVDADPARAEELLVKLKQAPPSAASQLLAARVDASHKKESAREAYGKALSLNPELALAKIERTALELKRKKKETIEELLALHVAYPHVGKLRRVLFRAGE
jgi:tetratricopeptide (TPR) repeat protein